MPIDSYIGETIFSKRGVQTSNPAVETRNKFDQQKIMISAESGQEEGDIQRRTHSPATDETWARSGFAEGGGIVSKLVQLFVGLRCGRWNSYDFPGGNVPFTPRYIPAGFYVREFH